MSKDKIITRRQGSKGEIILNNPERHNAISLEMWEKIKALLHEYIEDSNIRVITLSGAGGKAFASGADISRFDEERSRAEAVSQYNTLTAQTYRMLFEAPKPTIACISGFCLGGGLALATCCDIRIASENSVFGLPAAKLGIAYPYESLKRLVSIVGVSNAKDLAFSARRIKATEAKSIGLVNRVVKAEALTDEVNSISAEISQNAPLTIKAMKEAFSQMCGDPERLNPERRAKLEADCFFSEDYKEGKRAFLSKTPPIFKGS